MNDTCALCSRYDDGRLMSMINGLLGMSDEERQIIYAVGEEAWTRCMKNFSYINNSRFNRNGINPYHSVQLTIWYYYLANTIYDYANKNNAIKEIAIVLCDKIFLTSLTISGMDLYYGQSMPDIWLPTHTSGVVFSPETIIGDYFLFGQGCNIGMNKQKAPRIGEGVVMYPNSKILGESHIGNYVMLSANTCIIDTDIPDNSIVFGQSPNLIIKENHKESIMKVLKERFVINE